MKIAYTGPKSYVGKWLRDYHDAIPIWADIRNRNDLRDQLRDIKPDIVVHLAAKTGVDYCEKIENQKECDSVNLWGTANVADLCFNMNVPAVMLSTFQVFDGKKWIGSYSEKDNPNPLNYYGLTKLAAEAATKTYNNMKIIRTGYLFDSFRLHNRIEELEKEDHSYPTFQKRSFMHVSDFCDSLVNIYLLWFEKMPRLLHISGSESVSWYEFMKSISTELGTKFSPLPRKTELESVVPRPHNAGLNNRQSYKLGFPKISFRDGLRLMK